MNRYARQLLLPGWGPEAQAALSKARVLVVGAGGLGCPALQYLAAAGVGTLGIVDEDRVSVTDLHRQILYTTNDVGALKVERAAEAIQRLNPEVRVVPHPIRLTSADALDILQQYDLVLDASDNFGTRYMVNDACALLGSPLIYGSVTRFEGQVAVFHWSDPQDATRAADYRDLFPHPPAPGEILSCEEAGVLGVVAGIIGNLQALEALKIITGQGRPLAGRLLTYRALDQTFYEIKIEPGKPNGPRTKEALKTWPYPDGCGVTSYTTIDNTTFDTLRKNKDILVLDVREKGEQPLVEAFTHEQCPLSQLRKEPQTYKGRTIIVFCQTGVRSREAANLLAENNTVYQLDGGIVGWLQQ